MTGWHLGLYVAIAIPATVLLIAVFSPPRIPKNKSVKGIRERIEAERRRRSGSA
ncbi:hypothetical protein [Nocardia panacis]|nr:hypothetical protein [Nocardia panacis]